MFATLQVFEGGFIGSNKTSFCASFNAHVAHGHAAFHRKRTNCRTAVFDDMSDAATCSNFSDDGKDDVFGGHAIWCVAVNCDRHPLWASLRKRLSSEHMFYFACTDTKCKCTEGTVCCCVAVAAHNGHTRKSASLFWPDDMNNSLVCIAHRKQCETKLCSVIAQYLYLSR